ncbi:NACHT domain-containing protein [Kitasatospora sp. NPDC101183]|uniref:NACHT domain-containing protein n=1 Tax=Kitasatospora sp. NPDC101183 TaxID=3364100 RepID=UPI0037FF5048
MPGGRPPKGDQEQYAELRELAVWFRQALLSAGFATPNAFVQRGLFDKGVVYGVHNAVRLLTLDDTKLLAMALKRDPAEVEPIWRRAKQARDRSVAAERTGAQPRLESWDNLPLPALALRNLLDAQSAAVDRLPYDILDVQEPPLSAIYVRQQVRRQARRHGVRDTGPVDRAGAAKGGSPVGDTPPEWDAVLPAPEVLGRHAHLLVTGEPGAGKSTLTSHLTWCLARIWLRETSSAEAPTTEPVVPLRIAARTLADSTDSWSETLCKAVRQCMGPTLVADPEPGIFAGRVQGARWLVLVDGLDEVTDRQARTAIIRTIAQHAKPDSAYRFLVTTRPLPESELAPLRRAAFTGYRMEPFSPGELADFATKWFRAQEVEDVEEAAGRFLRETEDGRLSELVANPLLATIAAVSATLDPQQALPTNRLSLYRRFFDYLLRRSADSGSWSRAAKEELLEALGRHRIESDGPLEEAALRWAREHGRPDDPQELCELLLASGLLVRQGDSVRFLHHSFAEYLAARSYAREIPPDFPELADWVRRGTSGAEQTLALFTFRLWADRAECDGALVIDHLLAGLWVEDFSLAALLVAEGASVDAGRRTLLYDRLEQDARNDPDEAEACVQALASLSDDSAVVVRLHRLAKSPVVYVDLRLHAIAALARHPGTTNAEGLLKSILPDVQRSLPHAARISLTISSGAQEAVLDRARALPTDSLDRPWMRSITARVLEILGRIDEVGAASRAALLDLRTGPASQEMAAESWLRAEPEKAADQIAELVIARPSEAASGTEQLALLLERSGETDAALRIAGAVLRAGEAPGYLLKSAARIWARCSGDPTVLLEALDRCTAKAGYDADDRSALLQAAAELGAGDPALDWARTALGRERGPEVSASAAITVWLAAAGPGAAPEIMELLDQGDRIDPFDLDTSAEAMLNGGAPEAARQVAERALCTPNGSTGFYRRASAVLFKVSATDAIAFLSRESGVGSPSDPDWTGGVLTTLRSQESDRCKELLQRLAERLLDLPVLTSTQLEEAIDALGSVTGRTVLGALVDRLSDEPRLSIHQRLTVARALASVGEHLYAFRIWRDFLAKSVPPHAGEWTLLQDVQAAGAADEARTWIRELIDAPDTGPGKRLRLRQMLAWLSVTP